MSSSRSDHQQNKIGYLDHKAKIEKQTECRYRFQFCVLNSNRSRITFHWGLTRCVYIVFAVANIEIIYENWRIFTNGKCWVSSQSQGIISIKYSNIQTYRNKLLGDFHRILHFWTIPATRMKKWKRRFTEMCFPEHSWSNTNWVIVSALLYKSEKVFRSFSLRHDISSSGNNRRRLPCSNIICEGWTKPKIVHTLFYISLIDIWIPSDNPKFKDIIFFRSISKIVSYQKFNVQNTS